MFLEPQINDYDTGWIEVICGSMFSGKTEELIRRLKRAKFANLKTEIFKPMLDKRYHEMHIVSHDENYIPSTPVESSHNILLLAADVQVVGIDEAQFFDDNLPDVCNELANRGTRVIVAGLDMDFMGKPFGPMPNLMAIAEFVTKVHAVCVKTGKMAQYSHKKNGDPSQVQLGEKDLYEPLSRQAYYQAMKKKK